MLEEGICYDQCVLLAKLCKPLPCFILYSKVKFAFNFTFKEILQVSLDFLLLHSSLLRCIGHLFGVLVLEGPVDLHRTIPLQLLQDYWLGIDLDYCDIDWFALETNRDHSVVFDIASKYCILVSFVDYDGCFISS